MAAAMLKKPLWSVLLPGLRTQKQQSRSKIGPKAGSGETRRVGQKVSGYVSKPIVWGTLGLHPGFPSFSSFPCVISASPALNPLVCSCLNCLRRFRSFCDVRHFRVKGDQHATIGANPRTDSRETGHLRPPICF